MKIRKSASYLASCRTAAGQPPAGTAISPMVSVSIRVCMCTRSAGIAGELVHDLMMLGRVEERQAGRVPALPLDAPRVDGFNETAEATARELQRGLQGLLATSIPELSEVSRDGTLIAHPRLRFGQRSIDYRHYLSELARKPQAVRQVLPVGGLYLVEVPDPESLDGKILGQYWFPWFQPQHQHFVSAGNLEKMLAARGFETLEVQRAEVHIPVDFSAAAGLYVNKLHPRINVPWRPRPTAADRVKRAGAMAVGAPVMVAGTAVDLALRPLGGRLQTSNAYRLLARKVS